MSYINQKRRCHTQTTVDTVEHGPSKGTAVDMVRAERVHADATAVVDAPGKDTNASEGTEDRLSLVCGLAHWTPARQHTL